MIIIDIELKGRNHIKEFFHKLHSKLEDIAFSIIQRIPEKLLPHWLMNWLEKYLDKRISEYKTRIHQNDLAKYVSPKLIN